MVTRTRLQQWKGVERAAAAIVARMLPTVAVRLEADGSLTVVYALRVPPSRGDPSEGFLLCGFAPVADVPLRTGRPFLYAWPSADEYFTSPPSPAMRGCTGGTCT